MANVTEKDIINHLREKIRFHQNEAKRIEGLLGAFTNESSSTARGRKAKSDAEDEALISTDEQPATEKKKRGPAKKLAGTPPKPLEVPEKYTDDLTINSKIAFALKEIGSGFNEQIAEAMAQYEPKSDAKKISKQISGVLSTLKSKGQLKVEKVGRKDRFSLA
jgi:hypothetical protein